jgi:PAS domain S-box-containing protein
VAGRIKIVAIVDEPALAEEVRSELSRHYDLDIAITTEGARARLEANPDIDVVLLPEFSDEGPAVARAAQLAELRADLPLLVISADPENGDLSAAIHGQQISGAVQVPWRPGELASAVERTAMIGRLRRELETMRNRMQRRLDSLAIMNELASAIADSGTHDQLARILAQGLYLIVRGVDIGVAFLTIDGGYAGYLHLHCHQPSDHGALRAARDRCMEVFRSLTGRIIEEDKLTVDITGDRLNLGDHNRHEGSFSHVPVYVDGVVAGIILAGTNPAKTLTPDEDKLMFFLAARAAEALKRLSAQRDNERRRLSLMIDAMADGLIYAYSTTNRVLINPAAREMLGIDTDQQVTTQFLKERLGFYPFDLVAARKQSSQSPSESVREEVRVGTRSFHSIVSPVRDRTGKLVGVVVVLRDMTEAKELARRQSEFVSVVSHELRTPLTSITGALDIVLSGYAGRVPDKQQRYLKMARESCAVLNALVDDLLDTASADDGDMPVHLRPLVLDDLAYEVIDRYREEATTRRIAMNLEREQRNVRIVGDADRLTQVLTNLLSNAVKFTTQQGEVQIDIFGHAVSEDYVCISVYNSGNPIPREAQERVFDKFEQLDDVTTRKVGGTGLGLPISRAIIEAHGGRIWVESLPSGTRFVFILPVTPDAAEAVQRPGKDGEEDEGGGPSTVLIVADQWRASYTLKGILLSAGYHVLVAEDADEALSLAREEQPSLAIIYTNTPDRDGLALVEIFRHDPDTRKTAVLVVSTAEEVRDATTRSSANEYLQAPLAPSSFVETCAKLIHETGRVNAHRVLVVDDDEAIRAICREVLENAGYAVREVPDGFAAINEAKRYRPDLMLLDIMMPDMDGFQTAERLKSDPQTSMTPIIFLSAKGATADKVRAFRSGAEDYVTKPFDAAELVARVAKAVERHAREVGASPTTQLPGSDAIEAEIDRRLKRGGDDVICYLDLDNLKAFNDYYGYAKADGIIRQIGDVIRDVIAREGSGMDFIGHIAGDDFVFITGRDRVDAVCQTICSTFDRLVPLYYNKSDREKGFIEAEDRFGVHRKFPIMSVSIAAVTVAGSDIQTYSDLSAVAAQGKKLAKEIPGSSYVRDGKIVLGKSQTGGTGVGGTARIKKDAAPPEL